MLGYISCFDKVFLTLRLAKSEDPPGESCLCRCGECLRVLLAIEEVVILFAYGKCQLPPVPEFVDPINDARAAKWYEYLDNEVDMVG